MKVVDMSRRDGWWEDDHLLWSYEMAGFDVVASLNGEEHVRISSGELMIHRNLGHRVPLFVVKEMLAVMAKDHEQTMRDFKPAQPR